MSNLWRKFRKKFTENKTVNILVKLPFFRAIYRANKNFCHARRNRKTMELLYKLEDLNDNYYNKIKNSREIELEHQVGRLNNFNKIIKRCSDLKGDFIEFGTWKGFSLLWTAYLAERHAIFNKKIVGLDGFIGLPESDGVFLKGAFRDSTLKKCKNNVIKNRILYEETRKNIIIGKYLFEEKTEILKFLKTHGLKRFCFIHIDCDIYQSALQIFDLFKEGDLIANEAYILFDDYGWESQLAETVDKIFEKMKSEWDITVYSETLRTKNFYLKKKTF